MRGKLSREVELPTRPAARGRAWFIAGAVLLFLTSMTAAALHGIRDSAAPPKVKRVEPAPVEPAPNDCPHSTDRRR